MRDRPLDVGWLRIFEAVGRLGSLTKAAQELGLSQPAVTYQIRRIEEQLGATLFHRSHGGSRLSEAGEMLYRVVHSGLERIDEAARDIRRRARAPAIRIFTDYGFAAYWLMPRVADFRRLHPHVEVHIVASQSLEDESAGDVDAAVLFGERDDFPEHARLLMPERVVPVCAPGFLTRYGPFEDTAAVARAPLLHLETSGVPRWLTWSTWLAMHGVTREPAQGDLGLNTYGFVIQAALAEQGIALGWIGLVDTFLAAGTLVAVAPEVQRQTFGYWLIPHQPATAATQSLTEWLISQA
ncbi:LysR substrate-binding domain-containing protein [Chelativorans sp. SCAU2101]|uniref:LysR substrate-binding domain-containing protein n=1 Tax=Chelativorans petroleitrophicus TaxID=2975484 RepID=A0A9X3B7M8_9HYPH|nr:LysR substrate-binding domain-containing protein [Chelativorans petroleitrophicus]MCT8991792.1 LysR substrate-binding domain-containing protein [Chelativorans petroleitrophicus]